jgi:chromosome segregation ATPase
MGTVMSNKTRNTAGKFAPKSEAPRKVRSVNLTDDAWQWLATVADKAGMSRNDYLEALAESDNPLIEMAQTEAETDGANIAQQQNSKAYPLIETVRVGSESLKQELEEAHADYAKVLESSTHVTNKLRQEVQELRSQLEQERADRSEIEEELAELAQLKKEAKEAAAEIHAEGRSIELEKVRWQRELSDARAEIADAKATILNQGNKIRELERGYSLKPNPAERRLRLEIGELQTQLSDLKQNSATASKLPEAANLLNQLKARRKKSSVSLADVELILEMIEES